MSRSSRLLLSAGLVLLLALAVAWAARRPLSEAVVARWFAGQGVDARYRITAISPSAVTLEGVSLGPVAKPDFTAERIEARVGWLRPRIDVVTLVRPSLRAVVTRQGLSLGRLDRLLPQGGGAEPLPDIDVRLVDARLLVDTPAGLLVASVGGAGRLRNGFRGEARIAATTLAAAGCAAAIPGARVQLATRSDAALLTANGVLPRLSCAAATVDAVAWQLAATLPPTLDRYQARLTATTGRLAAGAYAAATARIAADATVARLAALPAGAFDVGLGELRAPSARARSVAAQGTYRLDAAGGRIAGNVALGGAAYALPGAPVRDAVRQVAGTLAQPLLERFVARAGAAARSFDASATIEATQTGARREIAVTALQATAANGARLVQTGRSVLADDGLKLVGGAMLTGGGLPQLTLTGDGLWRDGAGAGQATLAMARWSVPGASVEIPRLEMRATGGAATAEGDVTVSGGLGGGIVAQGLRVPLALRLDRGRTLVGTRCAAIGWASLSRATVRIAPGSVRLCPVGPAMLALGGTRSGALVVDALRLSGSAGNEALRLASAPLRVTVAGDRLALAPVRIDAAYGARAVVATVDGGIGIAKLDGGGSIAAASYADPASPFAFDRGGGKWRLAGSTVSLTAGAARVTDKTAPARFEPLAVSGVTATLADGRIEARGSGGLVATPARLFGFTAQHDLASARGSAMVETGVLSFGPQLQPYQITENLRGIVDNVVGPVNGSGRFDWTADTLASSGTLRIDHLSLATVSLGPIDDIDGTLAFDDLIALTTPPGQVLKIKRINPGIAVDDGIAIFRLLGPDAAAIDSMVWPYSGGTLTLAPVVVRAGDLRRDFLLTVDNLDAEKFLQLFEIKNLNVTGRFDGRLPLVFADGKGRIVGGRLSARKGGGLVQYVGDVGGGDLGAGAQLAFDALRRLRYKDLGLDFDGDLDGELVTQVRFAGINETVATLGKAVVPIKATGLPFKFNVTVRAPFRALMGTAASFSDVRPLLRAPTEVQPR